MQLRRIVVCVMSAGILASAACTHPATSVDTASAARAAPVQPPKMLPGPPPRFTSPGRMDAIIEVLVKADGSPDMTTLRITGSVSGNAWSDLRSWIAQSLFTPARQNGIAVAAMMKMELRSQ